MTFCFGLNRLINERGTHVPTFHDIRSNLFTIIGLRERFFQFLSSLASRSLTAFADTATLPNQLHTLPLELGLSPSMLQSHVNRILISFLFINVIVHCDDNLIFTHSENEDKPMRKVHEVFTVLEEHDARNKIQQTQIGKREALFLGVKLNKHGWQISEKYFGAIHEIKKTESVTELRARIE